MIVLENQKGLFHHLSTHFGMPVKRLMIFGPCQETPYTAITLNPESSFTRHTLTYPELLVQVWMFCMKAASMTIGVSMEQEICLILGQVSLSSLFFMRNLQMGTCGPGRD